jgi:hypothetical protein
MLHEYSPNTAKNFTVPTFDGAEQLCLEHKRLLSLTKVFKLRSEDTKRKIEI